MDVWTYGRALDKVSIDLDLTNETFINTDEMVGYFNSAIRSAEANIHKLGMEDEYFTTSDFVSLVQGTSAYAMPTNIYANKLRGVIYADGTTIYPVRRIRERSKWYQLALIDQFGSAEDYRYIIKNVSALTGYQFVIYPTSRETSALVMKRWYIRAANQIPLVSAGSLAASRAILIDIPEFIDYVMAYTKFECLKKEPTHPLIGEVKMEVEEKRSLMMETLTEMVPDDDNTVEQDFSHYSEMS